MTAAERRISNVIVTVSGVAMTALVLGYFLAGFGQ